MALAAVALLASARVLLAAADLASPEDLLERGRFKQLRALVESRGKTSGVPRATSGNT